MRTFLCYSFSFCCGIVLDMSNTTLLKYAGNKRKIMGSIVPHLGNWVGVKRYVEPFCGALGSALNAGVPQNVQVVLSDANRDLIELYEEVVRDAGELETAANALATDEISYYAIRAWDRDPLWPNNRTKVERAARTLYLNKRGFNGLYRTNKYGYFTTPWCRNPNPRRIDVMGHGGFISFLQTRGVPQLSDWRTVVGGCGEGDVVYCDPPYVDLKDPKRDFSGYLGAFGWKDQVALRDELVSAHERGARVVMSNSWCDATLELYEGWNQVAVSAPRNLSAKASSRGTINELLAWLPGRVPTV